MLSQYKTKDQAIVVVTWPEQVALREGASQEKADISARQAYKRRNNYLFFQDFFMCGIVKAAFSLHNSLAS